MTETGDIGLHLARARAVAAARALDGNLTLGARSWATVDAGDPVLVHDLTGASLFYDFPLHVAGEPVGTVRAAATAAVGAPVVAIETQPRQSPEDLQRRVAEAWATRNPDVRIDTSRLVCYAYPKVAVELQLAAPERASLLVDPVNATPIGEQPRGDPDNDMALFSFLEDHPVSRADRLASFARLASPSPVEARLASPSPVETAGADDIGNTGFVWLSPIRRTVLGVQPYGQVTPCDCVPASAQMMLDHYGFNADQAIIADALGTTSTAGTTLEGLTDGIAQLTNGALVTTPDETLDRAAQLANAVAAIAENQPVFTKVPGHFRVCIGYTGLRSATPTTPTMLYILDPWPWNPDPTAGGTQYWETWSSSPVLWFGHVRHAAPE